LQPHLISLVTEVPEFSLRTEEVIAEAKRIFAGRHQDFERMLPVFVNTGIANRFSVRPYAWFRGEQGWPERTHAFIEGSCQLFRKAASAPSKRPVSARAPSTRSSRSALPGSPRLRSRRGSCTSSAFATM
jgi:predicted naringenin-chalcone synthase